MIWSWNYIISWENFKNILKIKKFKKSKIFLLQLHFSPVFQTKIVKINPESFFWWKIVKICHIASPKRIKIVDFRGFLCFWVKNPGLRVEILKMQFLKKGSTKNFKKYGKQTPRWYIFMGCWSWPCSKKKLISPQKPIVGEKKQEDGKSKWENNHQQTQESQ